MQLFIVTVAILVATTFDRCHGGPTEAQMADAGKLMRNVCQPKFKISDELADGIKEGKFPDDKNLKCYINCVMEMMQTMRKGKLNYESSMRQIDILVPDHLKEPFKAGLTACKDSAVGIKNHCEAAYTALQCFFKNNPKFMFP